MIELRNVHKRYRTTHGAGRWVLKGITLDIPARRSVGLVGANGEGKSTLLRLIGGIDTPTKGKVVRHCRASWPLGLAGGLQSALTGRQNAIFVCRIHGQEADIPDKLAFIADFAEIGAAFDEPIKTYSSGMQARLKFAMSMAFDFEVYLVDELTSVGDAAFRKKARAAFNQLACAGASTRRCSARRSSACSPTRTSTSWTASTPTSTTTAAPIPSPLPCCGR